MKSHHSHTTQAGPTIAVMGDEALTRELIPQLEAHGIDIIAPNDEHAIKAAARHLTAAFELTVLSLDEKQERLRFLDAHLGADIPIISSSVTVTALAQSPWMKHPARLIGFSGFPTLMASPLIDVAPTLYTSSATVKAVRELFTQLGKDTVCVQDRTGMIVPAMIAQIVNEALMTVHQGVASAHDVDTAMKLAVGYPKGPIEWGEAIGFRFISAVLDARRAETGEERWRATPLLRQLAMVGHFWHEPEPKPEYIQETLALSEGDTTASAAAKKPDGEKKTRKASPKTKKSGQ